MAKPPKSAAKTPAKAAYKLWGGRFEKGPGELLETFSRSIQFDYRLAVADLRGTKAYAHALQRARILTPKESARAARALDALADRKSVV